MPASGAGPTNRCLSRRFPPTSWTPSSPGSTATRSRYWAHTREAPAPSASARSCPRLARPRSSRQTARSPRCAGRIRAASGRARCRAGAASPWPTASASRTIKDASPRSRTPTGSRSTLSGYDLHLLGEGTHFRLFERLGAHPLRHEDVDGVRFAVWAPNARRVSVVGDWNGWDGRTQPMRLHPGNGIWEIFLPGRTAGRPLQVRDRRAGRRAARAEVGPAGLRLRAGRSAHRLRGRGHRRLRVGRRGVDGRAQAPQRAPPPHVGLRGAPGLVAAPRARHAPELPGAGRAARRLRERDGLHPRRAPADHRAPVLRLLGLPDARLLTRRPAATAPPPTSWRSWTRSTAAASG